LNGEASSREANLERAKIGASPRRLATALCLGILSLAASAAGVHADKNYAPGITDTEIKIGQTMAYSGPASAYGTFGKAEMAYFKCSTSKMG
jgi:hypothetical protein